MRFTIALYGSFKDSTGYTWKLPNGYDKEQFDSIISNFTKQYSDGRLLGDNELYGGYYIDVQNDRFFAFRFIDGGKDALGRSGVVVTNWAIAQYSNLVGKDLKPLFDRLTMKEMPEGDSIEVALQSFFSFDSNVGLDSNVNETERMIWGEDTNRLFFLPTTRLRRNCLIQFTMKDDQKQASIKYLSPPIAPQDNRNNSESKKVPIISASNEATKPQFPRCDIRDDLRRFLLPVFCIIGVICVMCFLVLSYDLYLRLNTISNTSRNAPITTAHETTIIQKTWIIWTPSCVWKKKIHSDDSPITSQSNSQSNHYSWGELRIEQSKLVISFDEHVSLSKTSKDEYNIILNGKNIGQLSIQDAYSNLRIKFDKDDSPQKRELSGYYELFDKMSQESLFQKFQKSISQKDNMEQKPCATLLIREGLINYKENRSNE